MPHCATRPDGEHHCYAGTRCAAYDRARELPAPLPDPGTPLCPGCLHAAERDIRALPSDYATLEQWLPRPLSVWSDGQPKRGKGEQPLPLREHILVLQRHIWWVLTAWEPVVRELDHLSDPPTAGVREGWAVQQAANVIAPRLHRLARVGPVDMADYPPVDDSAESAIVWGPHRPAATRTPDREHEAIVHTTPTGADGILHLRRLHSLATATTGLSQRVRHLPGFCPACNEDDTLRQNHPRQFRHDPPVWCQACGAWMPFDEYERMVRLIVWHGA